MEPTIHRYVRYRTDLRYLIRNPVAARLDLSAECAKYAHSNPSMTSLFNSMIFLVPDQEEKRGK
jgi:hypothetical protein